MDSTKLAQINAVRADKDLARRRHEDAIAIQAKTSDTILSATSSLIEYLEGHTSKTEVVNQLDSISTPDVHYVVEALQVLDTTLKNTPQTDLSGVTQLMSELLTEARAIPKELPDAPELPQPIDNTKQLEGLKTAIQAVEKVVKAQKLVAEAPVVNVPETNVHVDAPDLKPLQAGFKDVVAAVRKIVIPEFKTDNTAVEKLLKQSNRLLTEILEKPVGGGGGGGGSSWTAVNSLDLPAPLHVNSRGSVETASAQLTERFDYGTSPIYYVGSAPLGSSESASVWYIEMFDLTSTSNALGKKAVNASWTGRAAATYV